MRLTIAVLASVVCLLAQDPPKLTAVHTVADHHTNRWTDDKDPLVKIKGVCEIGMGEPPRSLSCAPAPGAEPRTGRRHFYTIVLLLDLDENHYLAACASTYRNTACDELRAGQTFSAEVEGQTIRLVIHDTQLPLRILEFPRHPVTTTEGTPTHARPTPGSPSSPSWSKASEARGTPSDVRPSDVSVAAGAPSSAEPSDTSVALPSPTGARLYVSSSTGSARIYVDGQLIGPPPADVPVVPGRHTVTVRAPGFPDWTRRIDAPAGKITRLSAELRR